MSMIPLSFFKTSLNKVISVRAPEESQFYYNRENASSSEEEAPYWSSDGEGVFKMDEDEGCAPRPPLSETQRSWSQVAKPVRKTPNNGDLGTPVDMPENNNDEPDVNDSENCWDPGFNLSF